MGLQKKSQSELLPKILIWLCFGYLFFGFMLLPCLNTLTSIFTAKNSSGQTDPLAVIRFFLAGNCLPSISTSRARRSCASAT